MTAQGTCITTPGCGASAPRPGLNPWLKLAIGFAAIWVLIFGCGTLAQFIPGARHMAKVIDDHDLRATAIYYTDFKESYEGSEYIRHRLESMPEGR